ncbi:MAG: alpha/beta hydrolase [Rhodospirillaceae bacterium]|nr:alpha/beta hydrolase [Rhodospirillaceae bacterium]
MKFVLKLLAALGALAVIAILGIVAHANMQIAKMEVRAPEDNAPGRLMDVAGHKLHVVTRGDIAADATGAPVLMIHGFAAPGLATFMPWAEKLAAERALILPDLLGYGHSEHITEPNDGFTISAYSKSLAALLDQLGVAQVDVVGHSFGAAIGARFALDYPERVRRIILMDAGIYVERSAAEEIIEWPFVGRAIVWHAFGGGPMGLIGQYCRDKPDCNWMPSVMIKGTTDTLRAMMYTTRHSPDLAVLQADLPKLAAPALVIWGADDMITPVAHGDRLAREIKAEYVVYANTRHLPYIQQPDKVAERFLRFLRPEKAG